jgi:hypothetical protein
VYYLYKSPNATSDRTSAGTGQWMHRPMTFSLDEGRTQQKSREETAMIF